MKLHYFCLLFITIVCLTACSSVTTPSDTTSVENDGTVVIENEHGITKTVKSIPYSDIRYNDKNITLSSVDIYNLESEHGYYPLVVIRFDFSSLTEDDIYWLMKDQHSVIRVFDPYIYFTSEQNNLDSERMKEWFSEYDNETAMYIFCISDEFKNDFSDADVTVVLDIEQDETYISKDEEGNEKNYNKSNYYHWYINHSENELEIPVLDSSDIPADVLLGIQSGADNRR